MPAPAPLPPGQSFDAMLAQFVTPVLRAARFRKTRRTYRLTALNGSQALIKEVEYRFGEYRSQIWCFDDAEGAARCGQHLARIFTEETVPFLKRMLDRREQLAVLHDPATPTQQLHAGRNCFGDILLLVDDGPSAELDAALAEAERQGNDELASWAHTARLPRRLRPPAGT